MQRIIYYIATSIDGFIAGAHDDISSFLYQGKGVEKYLSDLSSFKTVIMGRRTYEAAYSFGLQAGEPAYQGMEHYILSDNLVLDNSAASVHVCPLESAKIKDIKEVSTTDIYFCGGGKCAEWLLKNNFIDQIKVKVNPIILGTGTKLFNSMTQTSKLKLIKNESFDDGMVILTYDVIKAVN